MEYRVSVVEDHELPAGTDWVLVQSDDGCERLLVKRSRVACPESMCRVMEEVWAASRALIPTPLPWWQRRATIATAAGVAAAAIIAVPSPLMAVYGA